ncbi:hypothetical protein M8494_17870 [Serratia ureilytica]
MHPHQQPVELDAARIRPRFFRPPGPASRLSLLNQVWGYQHEGRAHRQHPYQPAAHQDRAQTRRELPSASSRCGAWAINSRRAARVSHENLTLAQRSR